MGDGEVTSMLLGSRDDRFLSAVYLELADLTNSRYKATAFLLASYAFALIIFSDASDSFSVLGVVMKSEAWPHIALAVISFFSWRYSDLNSKISFAGTYLEYQFEKSSSARKAEFLLLFPKAFPAFQFNRTIRGFPIHVWPKNWPKWEGFALKVMIVLALTLWIVPISIYFFGIYQVWISAFPTTLYSKIYVVAVLIFGLLSVANPSFTSLKRRYVHYGLSNALSKLSEAKRQKWHKRIARLRIEREERIP